MTDPGMHLSWDEAVALMAAQCGVVALIGATDTGKSTLALAAANEAVRSGRRVAVVDADLGQGEIGTPGTLGLVRLVEPVATFAELKPRALAFAGDTSPFGHLLNVVQGVRRLSDHALSRGDDLVLVDTSGVVAGRVAEKLKLAKIAVLAPSLVVCLHRDREIERLVSLIRASTEARVVEVQSAPDVRVKSAVYRRIQRAHRMRRHFETARTQELEASRVRVVDAWVYTGTALPARQLKTAAEALETGVPYGEITPDGVFLCVAGRPNRKGYVVLEEEFRRKRIIVTPAIAFQNLLVGLTGPGGALLDVGILQGINFERSVISILTPARSLAEETQLHFGRLRVRPDGSELAHLR